MGNPESFNPEVKAECTEFTTSRENDQREPVDEQRVTGISTGPDTMELHIPGLGLIEI